MANRDRTTSASTPPITGADYVDEVAGHLKRLFDKFHLPISSLAGTNTITGGVDPDFDTDGYVSGMRFSGKWPTTNTSTSVTINLDSEGAITVLEFDGSAPAIGALESGDFFTVEYDGTNFILVAPTPAWIQSNVAVSPTTMTIQVLTASATWTKPSGCTSVEITLTGGGEGGNGGEEGGAAGDTVIAVLDVTSIASSTVTIGSGGAGSSNASEGAGSAGGDSIWSDGTNTITAGGGSASASSGGDITLTGGGINTQAGRGGASYWGSGYGAGGDCDSGATGSAGEDGVLYVREFYS